MTGWSSIYHTVPEKPEEIFSERYPLGCLHESNIFVTFKR
jgi:hypothetical protein